jgi:DNA segregation ATPase FtsK/SpoIIIE-like protein
MSERTRNGKTFAQDALGIFLCIVGGFFAVSIVLFLGDQQPKPGLVSALTAPVVELVTLLGSPAALLFSASLAALGTLLFLRTSHFSATRPLLALVAGSLGVALIFGGFGMESALGGWLPGLVPGFVGRILALVLGVALAWLGWTLVAGERAPKSSTAELMPRIAPRHEASGVSPAEAALLVNDARAPAARPAPRREAVAPLRDDTIRPFPPPESPAAPRVARIEAPSKPARAASAPLQAAPIQASVPAPAVPEPASSASESSLSVLTPPPPSWEGVPEEVQEEEEESAQRLSEALSEEFETEEASATEEEEEEEEEEEAAAEAEPTEEEEPAPAAPRASWEQIGLFDEQDLEEEAPPVKPARVELTPAFDFEASEPKKPAHEPEPLAEQSSAPVSAPVTVAKAAPAEVVEEVDADREEEEDEEDAEREERDEAPERAKLETSAAAARAPAEPAKPDFVLKPVPAPAPAPRAEPRVALEGEGWSKLVYDAGCVILEQKRVAVSMLERSFGIDFDQACRVLDELQQAGLIGPYMGGRTRDILLTREQWLPHAPHA